MVKEKEDKTPKVVDAEIKTELSNKLARATYNYVQDPTQNMLYPAAREDLDTMNFPDKPEKLIKLCRFFYKHDPIAGTVLNKMVDCAISELDNRQADSSEEEFAVYKALSSMLQNFYRNVCLEFLLSGLVVPHYEWVTKRGSDLSPLMNSRRRVTVPDNIWFRDPATLVVKNSIIPNKKYYYVKVDAETIRFIQSGGKLPDGTYDKETYDEYVKNYPKFVSDIKNKKASTPMLVLLHDIRPILGRCFPEDTYPTPYMTNALESLIHKRNLRKMDFSIASRVIAAIQLVKLGDDEYPCTDETDFDHIKEQMALRGSLQAQDRVFQLFGNHTLTIEWVFPNTEAMLNREKYTAVEDDIVAGLGFPRTLITGETMRSNVAGGSDFATFSPIASMQFIRDKLLAWTFDLYKEIKERNNFKNMPIPSFTPMKLYKLMDLNVIGQTLYMEGSLSRETRLEVLGLDLDTEIERKVREKDRYKEEGLDESPEMPYSGNAPDGGGGNKNNPTNETRRTTKTVTRTDT